jgi:hypothetical protein
MEATPEPLGEAPTAPTAPVPDYPTDDALDGLLPAEPEAAVRAAEAAQRAKVEASKPTPEPASGAVPAVDPSTLPALEILTAVLAHDVVNRAPVREATSFREGIEITCFNTINNPGPVARTVRHIWYHGDRRESSIALSIKGKRWRTWSSRPLYGVGAWRVDIVDEAGRVLQSLPFTVTP